MELDEQKIINLDAEYGRQENAKEEEHRQANVPERKRIEGELVQIRDRRATLARIVTRHIAQLRSVERKVFVSCHFENGGLPKFLSHVFDRMNAGRALGRFKPVIGVAEQGGDFLLAIMQKMIGCHFFLSVVTNEQTHANWPVPPYLVEEVGAAFMLPAPTIISIENGCTVKPRDIGKLYGANWQRLPFDRSNTDDFAAKLSKALDNAPEFHKRVVADTREALARLFV